MNTLRIPVSFSRQVCVVPSPAIYTALRHGHRIRGKPPGVAKTLEQRLEEQKLELPDLIRKIDIGYPKLRSARSEQLSQRLALLKQQRKDGILEKLARSLKLEIDLNQARIDWMDINGPYHIKKAAEHYGIYEHLFGKAYFLPRVELKIKYAGADDVFIPVYYGNTVKPDEAKFAPIVDFNPATDLMGSKASDNESWWSLVMTNPDGNFTEENKEYCHWFVGNIPGNDLTKGEIIIQYLQPFPPRGTGYHRYVYILYKQNKKLDFSNLKINDTIDLKGRSFSTLEFYRSHQDDITPAGLAFFQSDWEKSLTDFYHNTLGMQEPVYEYDFPRPYIRDQTWFPHKQPFNLYMDKYRDEKQVMKEYLERKLAKTHPFEGPQPKPRFPNAHPIKGVPSWLKTEMKKDRLGWGRINDV